MASQCCKQRTGLSGTFNANWLNTAQITWLLQIDTTSPDPVGMPGNAVRLWNTKEVLEHGQLLTPSPTVDPIPLVWSAYDSDDTNNYLFSDVYDVRPVPERADSFMITVNYRTPDKGETLSGSPLDWPTKYSVQYSDVELPIYVGSNIDALPFGNGEGGNRPAGTIGLITNAAGQIPTEAFKDTWRNAVWVIEKNYETLNAVLAINDSYQWTTNSDTVSGVGPRKLKFLACETSGLQENNGVQYYPAVTTIEVRKTTDLYFSNLGYKYIDDAGKLTSEDRNGNPIIEQIALGIDGKWSDTPIDIGFRYLTETAYAGLL